MVQASRARLTKSAPLIGGGAAGLIIAIVAVVLPATVLEGLVEGSGIAALLPVAAPPLGVTARLMLALGGGVSVAGVVWAALYLLVGPGGPLAARPRAPGVPVVRRADAHPDAPPRWPLSMSEVSISVVSMSEASMAEAAIAAAPPVVPVEQPVPGDLDVPLAAYDPDALPPVPMPPARVLRPLAPVAATLAPGERLETFPLNPPPPSAPIPQTTEAPSIDSLLRRLEQGARRRNAVAHG